MTKRRKKGFLPDIDAAREKSIQAKKRHDQPFLIKVKTENLRPANEKRKKYSDEDFLKVLVRMLQKKKSLNHVKMMTCRIFGWYLNMPRKIRSLKGNLKKRMKTFIFCTGRCWQIT
jgi:hypothetical protein